MSRWIRTHTGKLVNLAHMSEIAVVKERVVEGATERMTHVLTAYEPSYTESSPCCAAIAVYATRADAEEALSDPFDWLNDGVACDYTQDVAAQKAGA